MGEEKGSPKFRSLLFPLLIALVAVSLTLAGWAAWKFYQSRDNAAEGDGSISVGDTFQEAIPSLKEASVTYEGNVISVSDTELEYQVLGIDGARASKRIDIDKITEFYTSNDSGDQINQVFSFQDLGLQKNDLITVSNISENYLVIKFVP